MQWQLTGRRALVCGASQGLGLASARALAELGAEVTLFARNEARLQQALASLPPGKHDYLVADFSQPQQVAAAIQTRLDGGASYQILVNNTGGPPPGPVCKASPDAFRQAFEQHLINNQLLVQALLPGMQASGYGRIVNIISTSVKQPLPNLGVSNTIRGAVASWAKTLANELGPLNITVNNVLPGATATTRLDAILANKAAATGLAVEDIAAQEKAAIPLRRFGQPEEFGAAVAFLCSPAAAYITGINLPVDGGRTGCL